MLRETSGAGTLIFFWKLLKSWQEQKWKRGKILSEPHFLICKLGIILSRPTYIEWWTEPLSVNLPMLLKIKWKGFANYKSVILNWGRKVGGIGLVVTYVFNLEEDYSQIWGHQLMIFPPLILGSEASNSWLIWPHIRQNCAQSIIIELVLLCIQQLG